MARKFAWLLNPTLSIWRFWRIRKIGKQVAEWCLESESEKNIESIALKAIPHIEYASFELRHANYAYGHAVALKRYVGLPDIYPLKVSFNHGAGFTPMGIDPQLPKTWHYDFDIPAFLAYGTFEENLVNKYHPNNKVYVIGTPFLYADSFFSNEYIQSEKNRLGKNLLFFPGHSNGAVDGVTNLKEILEVIKKLKSTHGFASIRSCIFVKNAQQDHHKSYIENGIECVSAGDVEDCNFICRLKGLLEICDAVITNSLGSHVGYSISMNKPVMLISNVNYKHIVRHELKNCSNIPEEVKILEELLRTNGDLMITDKMREMIEPFWGLREKKTKEELRQILHEAEQLFQKSPKKHMFLEFR
jgi:hypothetical protein